MDRVAVVVNPVAGMGGRVGLKGTDGKVEEARARGAEQRAPDRARAALAALHDADPGVGVLAAGTPMGAGLARETGLDTTVIAEPADPSATTAADTRRAVTAACERGVDLVLFAGGDGTAVDVAAAIETADSEPPMLGVPAGVKVYSAVFGVSPAAAGHVAATFTETERAEINDIDEEEYRDGEVVTELRAVARVPVAEQRQADKQLGGGSVESLAAGVAADARPEVTYLLGPGSTVGAVKKALGFAGAPLGVDVYRDGEVLVSDGAETEILPALGEQNVIVVSPIGGQGFILGRGNQQLSPAVVRRSDLTVVASRSKLDGLGALHVDTGDPDLDERLRGWRRVRVGRFETRLIEVV